VEMCDFIPSPVSSYVLLYIGIDEERRAATLKS
jgi:hypothetical protein